MVRQNKLSKCRHSNISFLLYDKQYTKCCIECYNLQASILWLNKMRSKNVMPLCWYEVVSQKWWTGKGKIHTPKLLSNKHWWLQVCDRFWRRKKNHKSLDTAHLSATTVTNWADFFFGNSQVKTAQAGWWPTHSSSCWTQCVFYCIHHVRKTQLRFSSLKKKSNLKKRWKPCWTSTLLLVNKNAAQKVTVFTNNTVCTLAFLCMHCAYNNTSNKK